MAIPLSLQLRTEDPGNALATAIGSYDDHLQAGRYGLRRRRYLASVIHFGQWLRVEGLAASHVDEGVIGRFLAEHLPQCS